MYSPRGEISSKVAFSSDRSLGRIETHTIPPPHTVASLKACLMRLEDTIALHPTPQEHLAIVSEGATALHTGTQLFAAMNSEIPMNDDDPVPLLMGDHPGRYEDDPMAFVMMKRRSYSEFYHYLTFLSPALTLTMQTPVIPKVTRMIQIPTKYTFVCRPK